jgi:hypothetical protein
MSSERPVDSVQPGVELLFELLRGPHGAVHLGRMLRGIDSGRLVTLREVGALDADAMAAIDVARSLAGPSTAAQAAGSREHALDALPRQRVRARGVVARARRRRTCLALSSAPWRRRAHREGGTAGGRSGSAPAQRHRRFGVLALSSRCLFSDTVWIAEFGDVLLTDVNVAPLLAKNPDRDSARAAAKDLLSAAIELFQLASGEALSQDVASKLGAYVPAHLAETLEQALGLQGRAPFANLGNFVAALDDLPRELQADDHELSEELHRRLGATLEQRRRKLSLLELGASVQESDDVTRIFQASAPLQDKLDTVRPDAPPEGGSSAPLPKAPKAPAELGLHALLASVPSPPARTKQVSSAPVSVAPPRERLPRSFWLVAMLLVAALSAAWWATSRGARLWPPGSFTPTH